MVMDVNEANVETNLDADTSCSAAPVGSRTARVRRSRRPAQQIRLLDLITGLAWIKITVLGVLLVLLFRNQVYRMVMLWVLDPNWSHGFLIPLFSLYFLHQRRERLARATFKSNWLGLPLMIFCIAGYLFSVYPLKMGYPQQLALLGVLLGMVLLCCGWQVVKITWLPVLYLFFAMPIPKRWYVAFTMPMRQWASEVAAVLLNLIPNLEAEARGVIIDGVYKGQPFDLNVAEACAGMRLMMAFFALGVAMAYLSDRPYWHRIVLLLSTFPIALFCNFTRVTITGVIYVLINEKLATGFFHTALGLLMLPVAFFLYWVIAEVLNRLYIEEHVPESA